MDTAYDAFESFIKFTREPSMNIAEYNIEFEKRYNKAKSHGFTLADSCLGYFLLNQAHLSDDHKKLVRATISNLDLNEVKAKMNRVFGGDTTARSLDDMRIKVEDVNLTEEDVLYGNRYHGNRYDNGNYRRGGGNNQRRFPSQSYQNASMPNIGSSSIGAFKKKSYGAPGERRKLRCNICESTMHLSYGCPHKKAYMAEEGEDPDDDYTVVLYQSKLLTEDEYKTFVVESAKFSNSGLGSFRYCSWTSLV